MSKPDAFKKAKNNVLETSSNTLNSSMCDTRTENMHKIKVAIRKAPNKDKLKEITHPKNEQISIRSICLLVKTTKWAPLSIQQNRFLIYAETKATPKSYINLKTSEDFKTFEKDITSYLLVLQIDNQNKEAYTLEEHIQKVSQPQKTQNKPESPSSLSQNEQQQDKKSENSNVELQILEKLNIKHTNQTKERLQTSQFPLATGEEDTCSVELMKTNEFKQKAFAILSQKMRAAQEQFMKLFQSSKVKYKINTFPVNCSSCHITQVRDFIYACRQNLKIVLCSECALYKKHLLGDCEFASYSSLKIYHEAVQTQEKNQESIAMFFKRMKDNSEQKSRNIRMQIDQIKPDFSQ